MPVQGTECHPPQELCRNKLQALVDAGVTHPVISMLGRSPEAGFEVLNAIDQEVRATSTPLVRMLMPAICKVGEAYRRHEASLRCALCMVAAERFRLQHGDWPPVAALSLGALICGFFWEMWNYYSYPKWIYHTPGAQFLHLFEMPLLGYAGYIPFALELFALKNFIWPRGAQLKL